MIATAVLRGNQATAVPILLALLCILSVFVPAFIMSDPLRSLFMPLTLAVGFAMIVSYLLASTFVPDPVRGPAEAHGSWRREARACSAGCSRFIPRPWAGSSACAGWWCRSISGVCAWCSGNWGCRSVPSCFPRSTRGSSCSGSGRRPGSNFELTRQMAVKCLEEIEKEAKPENIEISMGYVGQVAPNFGIDNMVLFMRGPDDGQLRVALREDSGIKLAEFRERLRKVLPERVIPWLATAAGAGGAVQGGCASSKPSCRPSVSSRAIS